MSRGPGRCSLKASLSLGFSQDRPGSSQLNATWRRYSAEYEEEDVAAADLHCVLCQCDEHRGTPFAEAMARWGGGVGKGPGRLGADCTLRCIPPGLP